MTDRRSTVDDRTPILVGVATSPPASAGSHAAGAELEPIDVMVAAARAAIEDSGSPALAAEIQSVAVPVGNWSYPDPGRLVAERIGSARARTVRVEIGVPQSTPARVAAQLIAEGSLEAALVVGGEAKATQQRLERAGLEVSETDQGDANPDERWEPTGEFMAQAEIDAGIWQPVEQYACIDNALRHADGISIDEQLDRTAALWSRLNLVASTNPLAAFGDRRDESFLRSWGPGNRPLAFPYAKWHSTQWAVDQGAAMVLCSVGLARRLGISTDRWVFPWVLADSSTALSLSRRAELHRWPAMKVLGDAAASHLGQPLDTIDHVELYSCFPSAVRVQQRELGLPLDRTPSVTGSMAFAGGPFNNFTYQATAAITDRVRGDVGGTGLVTTVSGLLTKPGLAIWSTEPHPDGALLVDLGSEAAEATAAVASVSDHRGPGTVATYTVTYDGDAPNRAFVIADLDDGCRWVGSSTDDSLISAGLESGLIGERVRIEGTSCMLG